MSCKALHQDEAMKSIWMINERYDQNKIGYEWGVMKCF
jgi:hypothetical protein